MKIPILSGVYTDQNGDYRVSYPRNMVPVIQDNGITGAYIRPAPGIDRVAMSTGMDRGGINWRNEHYRVSGRHLVKISASNVVTVLGDVSGADWCVFDYSFDRLSICGGGNLYYYDGTTFEQVTDPDLGVVHDQIWVDGYFMTTDGEYLIVTELNDPMAVNPLKYGSSEIDPDPVERLLKVRNEPAAINRYTTEFFRNIGGDLFPFQRISGAQITKGCVGQRAACVLSDTIIMVGGGRNETVAVWAAGIGSAAKISTREIDKVLNDYTEEQLSGIVVESRIVDDHGFAYIHLPTVTYVYDASASKMAQEPIWYKLTSGTGELGKYRARGFVRVYDGWYCGDPLSQKIGKLSDAHSDQYGDAVSWDFSTKIAYNNANGAIFHSLELVGLPGRSKLSADSSVWSDYSTDGMTWSNRQYRSAGIRGRRDQRVTWMRNGMMQSQRIQRFGGMSDAHFAITTLEAQLEALNV